MRRMRYGPIWEGHGTTDLFSHIMLLPLLPNSLQDVGPTGHGVEVEGGKSKKRKGLTLGEL